MLFIEFLFRFDVTVPRFGTSKMGCRPAVSFLEMIRPPQGGLFWRLTLGVH